MEGEVDGYLVAPVPLVGAVDERGDGAWQQRVVVVLLQVARKQTPCH